MLLFDLETNGLLPDVSTIHCMVTYDTETKEFKQYNPDQIEEGLESLKNRQIGGHNILGYDLPVIQHLYPDFTYKLEDVYDTLIVSRLVHPDIKDKDFKLYRQGKIPAKMIGSHSLKAWGYRLDFYKGDFHENADWSVYSQEMLDYCVRDVELTNLIYEKLLAHEYSEDAIQLEHAISDICLIQERDGVPFDERAAIELYGVLSSRRAELNTQLVEIFGSWYELDKEFVPKSSRNGYEAGAVLSKVKFVTFNPTSRFHIAKVFKDRYGWEPTEFTETGEPKVDETVLEHLKFPEAPLVAEYFLLAKRIGQLAEGKEAWLKLSRNGKLHGRVNTMGTVTSRCSHSNPNLGQVPKVGSPFGKECRSLFVAPKGFDLLGCDVSGLELRMLAHFMARYDNGEYAKILLEGDIHTVNQKAAGLPTRDNAKTFIYGFLYGAGDEKIGKIVGKGAKAGGLLKRSFLAKLPALGKLQKAVEDAAKRGWLRGLDGRKTPIRSSHAALNTLLQGGGAVICKRWVVTVRELLQERGYVHGVDYIQVLFVHDEIQMLVREGIGNEIGKICLEAIQKTGDYYGIRIRLDGEYKIGKNWAETH